MNYKTKYHIIRIVSSRFLNILPRIRKIRFSYPADRLRGKTIMESGANERKVMSSYEISLL